jgi:hypothetical protein
VEEEYRGYALLLMNEYFSQENVDLFLNTTVNGNAAECLQHIRLVTRVPVGDWGTRRVCGDGAIAGLPKARCASRECRWRVR